jgi:hypothetical protein
LWAIGRVAQVAKDDMLSALPKIQTFILSEEESDTKEMAVWCAKQLTTGEKQ